MALTTPPGTGFIRKEDSKAAPAAADKPASLYKPRQTAAPGQTPSSPFASKDQRSPFSQTGQSAFGRNPQTSPFAKTAQPAGAGATSAFQPKPFTRQTTQTTTGTAAQATPQPRPFTSLRSQTQPQGGASPSPFSRFSRPTQEAGNVASPATGLRQPASPAARPSSPFRKDLHITDEEFVLLRDFIYQQCGIFIAENRKYLVENRLSNRIKELNLKTYNEYYNYLRFDNNRRDELTKLFEVVTTNETSFFRNPPQLEVFQRVVLAEAIARARQSGQKKIRIWSAGCSTGEEPYTLAIILHETLRGEVGSWDIKITANDLSEAVLAAARRGIYNEYALRTTPKEMVDKYFQKDGNVYKIDPAMKKLVSFGQINLSDREQLKRVEKSQIVFCRNVIIYFDDEMKRKVINAFYDNLQPSGVLIIGHSESLHNISRAFQLEHHKGTILYRKSN